MSRRSLGPTDLSNERLAPLASPRMRSRRIASSSSGESATASRGLASVSTWLPGVPWCDTPPWRTEGVNATILFVGRVARALGAIGATAIAVAAVLLLLPLHGPGLSGNALRPHYG